VDCVLEKLVKEQEDHGGRGLWRLAEMQSGYAADSGPKFSFTVLFTTLGKPSIRLLP